jgi:general secretion pathway protein F
MAVFEYEAIAKSSGKSVKGVIDADSPASARRKLREQELYPTTVQESFTGSADSGGGVMESRGRGGRVKLRDVSLMTRQLAVLLHAGMPLVEALGALLEQTQNARLKKTIYDIRTKVNEGSRLADGMAGHPKIFSELYISMVGAGESSGALEVVLARLADIQERQVKLRNRVVGALAYPVLMAVFAIGVISFLMLVIVPKITQMLLQQHRELPLVTKVLIGTVTFIGKWWWLLALVLFGAVLLWRGWVRRPEGRRRWDRMKLRLPVLGDLYQKMQCARFSRTLGSMLQSGLTMMNALDVVKSVMQNRVIQEAMDDVKTSVRRGRDLAVPLRDTGLFPPMLVHMTELGQRSGELEDMLIKVADWYDDEVETSVDAAVSLLEPIMIVVMGVFVGFLVISILLPIFQMSQGI